MTPPEPVAGPWELPAGWHWNRAADVAKIVGGSTPKNASDPNNFDVDGIPWITPADLSGYTHATIDRGRRSLAAHVAGDPKNGLLPTGAVLVSSRAPVGYCAVAANPVRTNQGFRSLILDPSFDPFFVRYYILASRERLEDRASGTTFKELSGTALGDFPLPAPPLEAQQRIVARINELFTELDDAEAALERAREDLGVWRKALLKAAVTGELTADWRAANPPAETGADLLAGILVYRHTRWAADPKNKSKKYVEPAAPDTSGLPALPPSWTWGTTEMLTDGSRNAITIGPFGSDLKTSDYREAGVPLIFVRHIRAGNFTGLRPQFVEPAKAEQLSNHVARSGDILITKMGDPPGDAALYPAGLPDGVITADCIRWRTSPALPAPYLRDWINSTAGSRWILSKTKGVAQQKITLELFRSMPVPIPPHDESIAVVQRLAEITDSAIELQSAESEGTSNSATLRQSILAAAFRGDLIQ